MWNPDTKDLCIQKYLTSIYELMTMVELTPSDDLVDHIKADQDYSYEVVNKTIFITPRKITDEVIVGGSDKRYDTRWEFTLDVNLK